MFHKKNFIYYDMVKGPIKYTAEDIGAQYDYKSQSTEDLPNSQPSSRSFFGSLKKKWQSFSRKCISSEKLTSGVHQKNFPSLSLSDTRSTPAHNVEQQTQQSKTLKRIDEIKQEISNANKEIDGKTVISSELIDELESRWLYLQAIIDQSKDTPTIKQCQSSQCIIQKLMKQTCALISIKEAYKDIIEYWIKKIKSLENSNGQDSQYQELSPIQRELLIEEIIKIQFMDKDERSPAEQQFQSDVKNSMYSFEEYITRIKGNIMDETNSYAISVPRPAIDPLITQL